MSERQPFGELLRALRKARGKSQVETTAELSKMFPEMRISQTSLSALECRATAPRGQVLKNLAAFYGVPESYFFQDDQDKRDLSTAKAYLERLRNLRPRPRTRPTPRRSGTTMTRLSAC